MPAFHFTLNDHTGLFWHIRLQTSARCKTTVLYCLLRPLLFGGYKFHLAKLNQDINLVQDYKIGRLASDSVRIAFFNKKTSAKTSKCTTLLPKSQFWQIWNAHCLSNLLLQDVLQQNQNNKCRVHILSKSGYKNCFYLRNFVHWIFQNSQISEIWHFCWISKLICLSDVKGKNRALLLSINSFLAKPYFKKSKTHFIDAPFILLHYTFYH